MNPRPLRCPRCDSPCDVVERVTVRLDWGAAVVGQDGIVRPEDPTVTPSYATAENSEGLPVPYGSCSADTCRHQWRLRRRFDPTALLDTFNPEGQS